MHRCGRVYWITGLKGSGKTTVGMALYYKLLQDYDNVLILDGDILKQFVGDSVGYNSNERLARGQRYSQLCKLLVEQGMIVVICTIAMFHEVRKWNRNNIKGYVEVFLNTPPEIIWERDKSKLYSFEEIREQYATLQMPRCADVIFRNDGTQSLADMVQGIIETVPEKEDDFARDRKYWNRYYAKEQEILGKPSDFAISVARELASGKQLLELGCGNGRDSLFFMKQGVYVTGVDASDEAIGRLQSSMKNSDRGIFVCDDFVKCRTIFQRQYDYIYSRFTLHAITDEQEDELLKNIKEAMIEGSKLFIEARTIRDDIFGKGKKVGLNAYVYEGHFRRFIDPSILISKMKRFGFRILDWQEKRGFSPTRESDPILLRLVACADNGYSHS